MEFSSVLSTETVTFPTKKITDASITITDLFEGFITDYHSIINYNLSTDGGKIGFRMINFLIKYFFNIDVTYTDEDGYHECKLTYNEDASALFTDTVTKNNGTIQNQSTNNIDKYLFQLMFNKRFREELLKATCDYLVEELQKLQTQFPGKDIKKYETYRHWTTTWYAAMQGDHQLDNIFEEYTKIFIDLNKDNLTKGQEYKNTGLKPDVNGPPCVVLPYYDVQGLNSNFTYWYEIVSMKLRELAASVKPDDISVASTKKRSLQLYGPDEKSEEDLEEDDIEEENAKLGITNSSQNDGDYKREYSLKNSIRDGGPTCIPKITDFISYRNIIAKKIQRLIEDQLAEINYSDQDYSYKLPSAITPSEIELTRLKEKIKKAYDKLIKLLELINEYNPDPSDKLLDNFTPLEKAWLRKALSRYRQTIVKYEEEISTNHFIYPSKSTKTELSWYHCNALESLLTPNGRKQPFRKKYNKPNPEKKRRYASGGSRKKKQYISKKKSKQFKTKKQPTRIKYSKKSLRYKKKINKKSTKKLRRKRTFFS